LKISRVKTISILLISAIPAIVFLSTDGCSEKKGTTLSEPDTTAVKSVLVEVFTNVGCVPCITADHFIDSLRGAMPNLEVIKYHTSSPYPYDPFYSAAKSHCDDRWNYYRSGESVVTPIVIIDGIYENEGSLTQDAWVSQIEERRGETPNIGIDMSVSYIETTREGTLYVNISGSLPTGVNLRIAMIESDIHYNAPNGDTVFNYVLRDMLPTSEGISLSTEEKDTLIFSVDSGWNADNIELVSFIQRESDGEVLQAKGINLKD